MKTFTLEDNEAQFIIQVIGELPSKTGASLLFEKLANQFNAQNAPVVEDAQPEAEQPAQG